MLMWLRCVSLLKEAIVMANGGGRASRKQLIGSVRNAVFWLRQNLIRICSVKSGINRK
jgi:hypothetical protein